MPKENNFVYPRDVQAFGFDWGKLSLTCAPEVNGARTFSAGVVDLPSGQGHARHNHPGSEEIIFVISGEGEQMVETPEGVPEVQKVGPGCTVFIPESRFHSTLNSGTEGGGGVTRVGDDCLLMTGSHVGHDATLGNRVILANQVAIAGHCWLGDDVIVGGLSGIHQWVRVGHGAIIGAVTMVTNDVIPYGLVQGPRGELDGLNLVGLRRAGFDECRIAALKRAYKLLYRSGLKLEEALQRIQAEAPTPDTLDLIGFIRRSKRGICR